MMQSRREDGHGHWPAGKLRNLDSADLRRWKSMRRKLQLLLAEPRRGEPGSLRRSARGLADHLGVADRTVRRWLDGIDCPPAETLAAIKQWISAV